MNIDNIESELENKLKDTITKFEDNLKTIRTGRANPSILDNVMVEAYETLMPLKQLGSVIAPEAQTIQITPYDPNNIENITQSIKKDSSLGLNPADDGHIIRITIPPLTEERRLELAKQVRTKLEEFNINLRNLRHEAINVIDKAKKDKQISDDDAKRKQKAVEDKINNYRSSAENKTKDKEKEITSI